VKGLAAGLIRGEGVLGSKERSGGLGNMGYNELNYGKGVPR